MPDRSKAIHKSHKAYELEMLRFEALCLDDPHLAWEKFRIQSRIGPDFQYSEQVAKKLAHWIQRLETGEPLAYILGKQEFMGEEFEVNSHVLIPRPETETLIQAVLDFYPEANSQKNILDLGTGSGIIPGILAKYRPNWFIVGADYSGLALEVAQKNTQKYPNICLIQGSWYENFCGLSSRPAESEEHRDFLWDAIVSNPPYIAPEEKAGLNLDSSLDFEPQQALYSPQQGLQDLSYLIINARAYLKPKAPLFLEHGFEQAQALREIFAAQGYSDIKTLQDEFGKDRVTMGLAKN
ncbi:MAG: peptide chain release factor N(5)-glutamine methyltransferase [Gammaproteobacteria bacterium]